VSVVLVTCTGNICRSPTAAALLQRRLGGLEEPVEVSSAGILDLGEPVPDEMIAVGAALQVDLSHHRGHRVTSSEIRSADLVIGMAREHVREIALLQPAAWPKTFTLKELLRRGYLIGPRQPLEPLGQWLTAVHEGRRTADLLGASKDDDVEDPFGGSLQEYRDTAILLGGLVEELAGLAWPEAGRSAAQ
jgi:protein-tyrosine phosphatase